MSVGLYVHLPWCIKKCPYCDFNSHAANVPLEELPRQRYINCLIQDLQQQLNQQSQKLAVVKKLSSIFIGGGTPSLFPPALIQQLLDACYQLFSSKKTVEVTMEVNPGATETYALDGYLQAGVNRVSIGVQSFNSQHLQQLGRIHQAQESTQVIKQAHRVGFEHINIDLMYALADQTLQQAMQNLQQAIALDVSHISYYQLIFREPNTPFAQKLSVNLPNDEQVWAMQQQADERFDMAGFEKYEITSWSKAEQYICRHNLNYWRFGDYVGIGAGAHGKLTYDTPPSLTHYRMCHAQSPNRYMQDIEQGSLPLTQVIKKSELPIEFMLNQLRLREVFSLLHYRNATGLAIDSIVPQLKKAQQQELISCSNQNFDELTYIQKTDIGENFLNNLQQLFLLDG